MDSDLKRRVELFLQQKGVASLPKLNIEVEGGQVMLQGTVGSFYERQLCLCCQRIAGVSRVVDELKVESTSIPQVSVARQFRGNSNSILPPDDQAKDAR